MLRLLAVAPSSAATPFGCSRVFSPAPTHQRPSMEWPPPRRRCARQEERYTRRTSPTMSTVVEVIPQTSLSKERPRARWRRNAFRATRMKRLFLRYGIGVWAKLRGIALLELPNGSLRAQGWMHGLGVRSARLLPWRTDRDMGIWRSLCFRGCARHRSIARHTLLVNTCQLCDHFAV